MFPRDAGGMAFIEYDYQDQNHNWANTGPAPAANNDDKEIRTHFFNFGGQYMFNRSWGIQSASALCSAVFSRRSAELMGSQIVVSLHWSQFRRNPARRCLHRIFRGYIQRLNFWHQAADWQFHVMRMPITILTGTVNWGRGARIFLLGGFTRHHLSWARGLTWFAQGLLDVPVLTQDQYRPGIESMRPPESITRDG